MANLLMKDLDLFEPIEDDAASKISGGAECTEENRTAIVSWLAGRSIITQEQANTLQAVDLTTFCTSFDDYIEGSLGVRAFNTVRQGVTL